MLFYIILLKSLFILLNDAMFLNLQLGNMLLLLLKDPAQTTYIILIIYYMDRGPNILTQHVSKEKK